MMRTLLHPIRKRMRLHLSGPSRKFSTNDEASTFQRIKPPQNVYNTDSPLVSPRYVAAPKTCSIIGAPMTLGQPLLGKDYGPKLLREKGLTSEITNLDWRVSDSGDLQFPSPSGNDPQLDSKLGKAKNCYPVGLGNKQIFEAAYESHQNQMFTLVIGGDHSVAFGTVAAAIKCNPDVGVVWVDAHADLNTPLTSPSGNMHGMPLGLLMGLCDPASIPGFEWMQEVPQLKPEQLSYIGLRDVDKGEAKAIRDLGIQAFTMHDIDRYGIGGVVNQVLKNQGDRPLHLSYDIDAVDPIEAPSTGTVVRGGLTFREAHFVAEAISDTGNLKSMDIVEVNPQLEPGEGANMTADMGLQLTLSAMGTRIL